MTGSEKRAAEFVAVVERVLATVPPPRLDPGTDVEAVAAIYPQPRRRPLFGVRAVAAAYGVEPAWLHAMYRNGQLRHTTEAG